MLSERTWDIGGRWPLSAIVLYVLGVGATVFLAFFYDRGQGAFGLSREVTWLAESALVAVLWALAIAMTVRARRRRSA